MSWIKIVALTGLLLFPANFTFGGEASPRGTPAPAQAEDCVQDRATFPAPYEIYTQTNPLPPTAENLSAGKKLYQDEAKPVHCAHCHGLLGKGKGLSASRMQVKPRDFTCRAMMKNISDGQLFWIIRNGSAGTAMWGYTNTLSDKQIWQIVTYIRQFSEPRHHKADHSR